MGDAKKEVDDFVERNTRSFRDVEREVGDFIDRNTETLQEITPLDEIVEVTSDVTSGRYAGNVIDEVSRVDENLRDFGEAAFSLPLRRLGRSLTNRDLIEKQMRRTEERIAEERRRREELLARRRERERQFDIAASRAAGGSRGPGFQGERSRLRFGSETLGDGDKDFLGL